MPVRRGDHVVLPAAAGGWVEVEEPASFFAPVQTFGVDPRTLIFLLGELPFLTGEPLFVRLVEQEGAPA